ncbi:MAG: transcriptional regulator MntR [Nitrososphaerota archaeon]|nr:transcriptional regulator MntR [Nitrososphaerota archaeon]MDG6953055.1 transcriptional regulator MntR [Nitrososphaerota archaeon]MDG6955732.1 transcriptional regulator MntR [Nitrososphaerota archaeon]MDG6958761.1 transcriptional regulator MntR [Nitrososphaerota archaeon]MDG6960035.1 transcriptional regulator MntR [Nitrososphaerota archaeon]
MAALLQSKRDISRLEDYLEAIYNLNSEKGYVNAADVSEKLGVRPPTVSSMVRNLTRKGFLEHERYRGMSLTPAGEKVAKSVIKRHRVISGFISMLGVDEQTAYVDTEGIEHHVHPSTLRRLERLAEYLRENPQTLRAIQDFVEEK